LPAIDSYLATIAVPHPWTGYEGIYKLPPAHTLTLRNGEIKLERYWSLDFTDKLRISEAEAVEELLERLEEAVRIRMISEVPLGAFLSGGIDSSAVVAMMARLSDKPVKTFSIGFKEKEFSEIEHAASPGADVWHRSHRSYCRAQRDGHFAHAGAALWRAVRRFFGSADLLCLAGDTPARDRRFER
jgi:asparagine synthetase B (glutamine-hydrolysing)